MDKTDDEGKADKTGKTTCLRQFIGQDITHGKITFDIHMPQNKLMPKMWIPDKI